jgi:excisionase family DNA binding protein
MMRDDSLFRRFPENTERLSFNEEHAAESIGVSPQHLANLRKERRVPFVRLGNRVLYPKQVLKEWLNNQCIQPIDPDDLKSE